MPPLSSSSSSSCSSCRRSAAGLVAVAAAAMASLTQQQQQQQQQDKPHTDALSLLLTRSINTGCFAATNAITKTAPALRSFIREVREARAELDAVLAEIQSLEGVLELLNDDAAAFPWDLAQRTPPLLQHCTSIVQQIEGYMHVCNGLGLSKRDKKYRWMAIKGDMEKLRSTLEGYKSTLAVVTDLVAMYVVFLFVSVYFFSSCHLALTHTLSSRAHRSKPRKDTDQTSLASDTSGFHRALEEDAASNDEQKQDLTRVMADMGSLRGRLQGDLRSNYAVSDLESYLDAMLRQATNLGFRLTSDQIDLDTATARKMLRDDRHHTTTRSGTNSTSGGDAPDSAIDLDGPPSPYGLSLARRGPASADGLDAPAPAIASPPRSRWRLRRTSNPELPIVEIEEFLDELTELPDASGPARPPTPPPKASRRASVHRTPNATPATTRITPPSPPSPRAASASLSAPRAPEPVTKLPLAVALEQASPSTLSPFTPGALPGLSRPASTRSVSEYSAMLIDSEGHVTVPRRVSSLRSLAGGAASGSDRGDAQSTLGSLRAISPPVINEDDYNPYGMVSATTMTTTNNNNNTNYNTAATTTTTTIIGGPAAARESVDSAVPPPIKDKRLSTSSSNRLFGGKNSTASAPSSRPARPASSMGISRSSQLLHSLNVPGVSSRALSPARAESIRGETRPPSSSSSFARFGMGQRGGGGGGTHVLTALAGPTAETPHEEDEDEHEHDTTTALPFDGSHHYHHHGATGRKHSVETAHTIVTQSSGSGSRAPRPSTAIASSHGGFGGTASIRSNSSRLSSMFRRVSLWKPRGGGSGIHDADHDADDPEPDDIFGVSLKKSMQMACATVKTHHDGTKASSQRQFPRCVLACVSYLRAHHGVYTANIFGGDMGLPLSGSGGAGMLRVAALKEHFSTPPYYGGPGCSGAGAGDVWTTGAYDVYDAAELIVLFLQQLPKPLVSETVAKRWIVMSKQATLPGSMGLRLDECIDFWDEALLGIRGAARDLFKLLLNLWGDIADAAEVNDMTAERLAARLLNPLMHLPAGKYTTDYMLGLAFLIRKRSEYSAVLRGGRKSKAAFEVR